MSSYPPPRGTFDQATQSIRRIIAPNPSPMTYHGTNTYLLGEKQVAVIDPGPNDDAHLSAILAAVPEGGTITHIFVTHAHYDHSELAMRLSKNIAAPIYAFGDHEAGKSTLMKSLSEQGGMIAHRAIAQMADRNPDNQLVRIGQFCEIGTAGFHHQIDILSLMKIQQLMINQKAVHSGIE